MSVFVLALLHSSISLLPLHKKEKKGFWFRGGRRGAHNDFGF